MREFINKINKVLEKIKKELEEKHDFIPLKKIDKITQKNWKMSISKSYGTNLIKCFDLYFYVKDTRREILYFVTYNSNDPDFEYKITDPLDLDIIIEEIIKFCDNMRKD